MFNLKDAIRQKNSTTLGRTDLADLIAACDGTDLRMVESKAGKQYLHVVAADGSYIPVGVSPKVELTKTGSARIKELVDNYTIFFGTSEEGRNWLTFAPEGTPNDPIATITIKDFLKKSGAGNKLAGG